MCCHCSCHGYEAVLCLVTCSVRSFIIPLTMGWNAVQNWDINEELPAEVEGPFHVAVATNVLHTGKNLKSEALSLFHHTNTTMCMHVLEIFIYVCLGLC